MKVFVSVFLILSITIVSWAKLHISIGAICGENNETVTSNLKKLTKEELSKKEKEIEKVIEKYEAALKSKREMMLKLDQNITRIEYVMKENQALRKKILMYWNGVKKTNSMVKSF